MDKTKTRDITLRIVSVIIAIILWTYVAGVDNPTIKSDIANIEVTLVNVDSLTQAGYMIVSHQQTIKLNVEGRKKDVLAAKPEDFRAEANLGGTYRVKGTNTVLVEIKDKPANIDIPNQALYINVELDEVVEHSFPVNVQLSSAPPEGYSSMTPIVKPEQILIKGASRYIGAVNSVVVRPDISKAVSDVTLSLPVHILDKNGKPINDMMDAAAKLDVTPNMVEVTVPIQRAKEVDVNVVTTGKLPAGVFERGISASPRTVTIVGSEEAVNNINSIDTEAVSLDNITGSTVRQAGLVVPEGITITGDIRSVNVSISVETTINRTFNVLVNHINLPEGLSAEFLTNTIGVTLTGQESALDDVASSDISAFVDLSTAPAEDGEYEFSVNVSPLQIQGVSIKEVNPQKIKVIITKKQG